MSPVMSDDGLIGFQFGWVDLIGSESIKTYNLKEKKKS
jgi:hypothetical protein